MINTKSDGTFLFVGVSAIAYGCDNGSNDTTPNAPANDAGTTPETGMPDAESDGGVCKMTQVPADYERCITFASQSSPAALPVTTACLPAALADERPKSGAFPEFAFGDYVLTEAYDLTANCAQPKTLVEMLRYNDIYINVTTEYTARADGAIGKTGSQFVRLPPPPPGDPDPDAGTDDAGDAGATPPPPELIGVPERGCPPKWPQVNCIDLTAWYEGGFFTAKGDEVRLFKNPPGSVDGGGFDPSTARLYAVYKKAP